MMVTIYRKGKTLKVPASTYPLIYEPAGWRRLGEVDGVENHTENGNLHSKIGENAPDEIMSEGENLTPENANFEPDEEDELKDLLEIPLSEMDSEQLKAVAMELDLDISGIKTKGELRKLIAEHLEG